jgi:serine protease Do
MRIFVCLGIVLFLFVLPAYGQEKAVPQNKEAVQYSYAPLVKSVAPAVVNIYTKRVVTRQASPFMSDPFFEHFFGKGFGFGGLNRNIIESALGSGVIVGADGLVVTNAHVVKEADEITVVLPDGREFEAKKALVDEPSDLALLRIDPENNELPFVNLRPSETLEVGDLVLAIGNPFGVGQTVTSGIVSALARSSLNISDFNFFIQTDAAINPGNSGGALVAMDGGVVGINSAIYSRNGGSMGLGFAIPSEMVATVIAAEKAGASGDKGIVRPWLGISAQSVTQDIADNLELNELSGALISEIHEASPAKKAGLKVGDVVVSVNGKKVRDPAEMKFRMANVPMGSRTEFTVKRKGSYKSLDILAMPPPEVPPRDESVLDGYHPLSGVKVSNVNPAVANELGVDIDNGVVVIDVARGGRAHRIVGIGDIIVEVNDKKIETVKDLIKVMNSRNIQAWKLIISRGGHMRQIVLR